MDYINIKERLNQILDDLMCKDVRGIVMSYIGKSEGEIIRWMTDKTINYKTSHVQNYTRILYNSPESFGFGIDYKENITTFKVNFKVGRYVKFNFEVPGRFVGVSHNLMISSGITANVSLTKILKALGITFESLPQLFIINGKLYDKHMYHMTESGRIYKRLARPRKIKPIIPEYTKMKYHE